jgi:hypothetical protein
MGVNLKRILRPGTHKPERKPASVRGQEFRDAQDSVEVKTFLEETRVREERLKREDLIHP